VNKLYGTAVIIAEETFDWAQSAIEARELDIVTVAGKSEKNPHLRADGGDGRPRRAARCPARALRRGARGLSPADWDAASSCFDACRNLVAADGPSTVYWSASPPSAARRRRPAGTPSGTSARM